eukprot:5995198-Amphidinium_carterae.1
MASASGGSQCSQQRPGSEKHQGAPSNLLVQSSIDKEKRVNIITSAATHVQKEPKKHMNMNY